MVVEWPWTVLFWPCLSLFYSILFLWSLKWTAPGHIKLCSKHSLYCVYNGYRQNKIFTGWWFTSIFFTAYPHDSRRGTEAVPAFIGWDPGNGCPVYHRDRLISHSKMTTRSGEVTISVLLSITRSKTSLKGHELTRIIIAPVGLIAQSRPLGNCKLSPYTDQCLFSVPNPAQKPHVGIRSLPPIHISLFLYLQQMKHSDRKAADIDWLVGTLFWVTFHKWRRLLK